MTAPVASKPAAGQPEMLRTNGVAAASPGQQTSGFDALLAAMMVVNEEQAPAEGQVATVSAFVPTATDKEDKADFMPVASDISPIGISFPSLAGREAKDLGARPVRTETGSPAVPTVAPGNSVAAALGPPEIAFMGGPARSLKNAERPAEIARIFNEDGLFHGLVSLGARNVSIPARLTPSREVIETLHVARSALRADPLALAGGQVIEPGNASVVRSPQSGAEQLSAAIRTAPFRDARVKPPADSRAAQGRPIDAQPPLGRIDPRGVHRDYGVEWFDAQRLTARILDLLRHMRASNAEVTVEFTGENVRVFVRTATGTREERLRLRSSIERLAAHHGQRLIEIVWNGERLPGGGA